MRHAAPSVVSCAFILHLSWLPTRLLALPLVCVRCKAWWLSKGLRSPPPSLLFYCHPRFIFRRSSSPSFNHRWHPFWRSSHDVFASRNASQEMARDDVGLLLCDACVMRWPFPAASSRLFLPGTFCLPLAILTLLALQVLVHTINVGLHIL